jgi:gamma-glutamylputrescine oxidase
MSKTMPSILEKMMLGGAQLASLWGYPLRWERLEFDDNRSVWAASTPAYQPCAPLNEDLEVDVAIIGGGYTGVSSAYHFSQRYPEKRIALLEAKTIANGASGRSGGMMLNWIYGVRYTDEAQMRAIYDVTQAGMDWIEQTIRLHNLPTETLSREGTLRAATNPQRAEMIHQQVEQMQRVGIQIDYLDSAALRGRLGLENVLGASFDPSEGRLNGALFLRSLRRVLIEQGVLIYEQTPVLSIEEGAFKITLTTPQHTVRAKTIVLATDAYTGKLGYFRHEILPLHGHVFATQPLTAQQRQQIGWGAVSGYADDRVHTAYSSLTSDGRIVFGGGKSGASYLFNNRTAFDRSTDRETTDLRATMTRYLPHTHTLPMVYQWTGTLGMTATMGCSIGAMAHNRNILYGLGYSGHGITLANIAGAVLADVYSGDDQRWQTMPFYNARLIPVPLDPLRWIGFNLINQFLD